MYSYAWDKQTHGYCLTAQSGKFVASELRPVFAEELTLTGLAARLDFDPAERYPLLWAKQNIYLYHGEEVARFHKTRYGKPLDIEWRGLLAQDGGPESNAAPPEKWKLPPMDVQAMIQKNREIVAALVADTLKRIKEMYDVYASRCDTCYISFSGGKDSVVLLDLCHRVLPLDVPVVFSDTDMELPDTYRVWTEVQGRYPERRFLRASAKISALENWRRFGPPSRSIRWCCSVHKTAPALLALKHWLGAASVKASAFLGVRGEESLSRSAYEDIGEGVKTSSQVNLMPILDWGSHELWLYLLEHDLQINQAYRMGLSRVGCVMCPESSERYGWFVDAAYPEAIKPYVNLILESSQKSFPSYAEAQEFVGTQNWQARKSGAVLNNRLSRPMEKSNDLHHEWSGPQIQVGIFWEWLKTLGHVYMDEKDNCFQLHAKNKENDIVFFCIEKLDNNSKIIKIIFADEMGKKRLLPNLRSVLHKSMSCVGCRTCEAECPVGAFHTILDKVIIDETTCVHCLRCHSADLGCWRYRSMRVPETSGSASLSGINVYKNFGLRTDFVAVYLAEREAFDHTPQLNRDKQVPAAKTWFRQALLMHSKNTTPTRLLDVFEKRGLEDSLAWDCVWLGLVNNAPMVKWMVCTLALGTSYSDEQIFALLGDGIKDITKKGGMQALKNMLVSTPLGTGKGSVCELGKKGTKTVSIKRVPRTVDPLATLYGLYVMAEKTKRSAFTVRQMMTAEMDSEFVSPLSAFGMAPDVFKKQIMGLAALHPPLITCSFTLGLDEVHIYPETQSRDDALELILCK
jgi:3'-phosphoadenosine 5'-phosphosulfate sulfotransferase (PAPS reductase)/FAD synthetase